MNKGIKILPEASKKEYPLSKLKMGQSTHIPENISLSPEAIFRGSWVPYDLPKFQLILCPRIDTRVNILLTPEITHCSIIILDNFLLHPPATITFTISADFLKGSNYFVMIHIFFRNIPIVQRVTHFILLELYKILGLGEGTPFLRYIFHLLKQKNMHEGEHFYESIYITKCIDIGLTTYFQQFKQNGIFHYH